MLAENNNVERYSKYVPTESWPKRSSENNSKKKFDWDLVKMNYQEPGGFQSGEDLVLEWKTGLWSALSSTPVQSQRHRER